MVSWDTMLTDFLFLLLLLASLATWSAAALAFAASSPLALFLASRSLSSSELDS